MSNAKFINSSLKIERMVDEKSAALATRYATRIERAQQREEHLLPVVVGGNENIKSLAEILKDCGVGKDYAEIGAVLSEAVQDNIPEECFSPLGKALILAAQSELGFTNAVAYGKAVGELLEKNGYELVQRKTYADLERDTFTFYLHKGSQKVVAISEASGETYTAALKSKFHLDELVKDFSNMKEKSLEEWESYRIGGKVNAEGNAVLAGLGAGIITGIAAGMGVGYLVSEGWGVISGIAIGGFNWIYGGMKILQPFFEKKSELSYQKKKQEEQHRLPYSRISSGMEALLDAFPLEENKLFVE